MLVSRYSHIFKDKLVSSGDYFSSLDGDDDIFASYHNTSQSRSTKNLETISNEEKGRRIEGGCEMEVSSGSHLDISVDSRESNGSTIGMGSRDRGGVEERESKRRKLE